MSRKPFLALQPDPNPGWTQVVGIGGIGTGVVFRLEGDHSLGREESRPGELLPGRDYCKLHIVEHYLATLMGTRNDASGFRVAAIGVVGSDTAGRELLQEMRSAGIDVRGVRSDSKRPTLFSTCLVYPDGTGGNITASNSAAAAIETRDLENAAGLMSSAAERCVALCLPEVPLGIRHRFLQLATECGNFRAASFTPTEMPWARERNLFSMIDLIALNREEAMAVAGFPDASPEAFPDVSPPASPDVNRLLIGCSEELTAAQPGIRILVSAGRQGAYAFADGEWTGCAAPEVSVSATGGAGDALLAGVLSGLAAGLPLTDLRTSPLIADTTPPMETAESVDSALGLGVLLATLSVTSPDAIHRSADLESMASFAVSLQRPFGDRIRKASRRLA